jgi:hypothetical protein
MLDDLHITSFRIRCLESIPVRTRCKRRVRVGVWLPILQRHIINTLQVKPDTEMTYNMHRQLGLAKANQYMQIPWGILDIEIQSGNRRHGVRELNAQDVVGNVFLSFDAMHVYHILSS